MPVPADKAGSRSNGHPRSVQSIPRAKKQFLIIYHFILTDLKWVSPDALPKHASWFSIKRWPQGYPPEPYNWCAGRTDVVYYHSASYSANNIFIDDSTVDYSQESATAMASPSVSFSGGGKLGPQYGSNDLWLEIKRYSTNQVSVLLHGATNGVWELLSKTNLAQANLKWQLQEMQIDDGTTNTLYFGPYPDAAPFIEFYRAELATNLFTVVATNLPSPVGVDYQGAIQSLILPINYDLGNYPYSFGIINTNGVLYNWSDLNYIDAAAEIRIATAKATGFGFTNGDTFFSSGLPYGQTPATIGWLSPDGSKSDPNWLIITNDMSQIEGLYLDQVGSTWSNDLFAVNGFDSKVATTNLTVYRVHYHTNVQHVASISATHLEGLLTLPSDSRYGPFADRLLTADENTRSIFAVTSTGSVSNFNLGFDADTIHLIPTNQDLYCVQFNADFNASINLLKIPGPFFYHWQGDLLFEQSGEVGNDDPLLVIVHWNGTSFETTSIDLVTYFPNSATFFEKCSFAPISLPPTP